MKSNNQEPCFLSRSIDYLGDLGAKLKDLQGYATLAHELLQNADDAHGVSTCTFNIRKDALIVDNNAKFSDCGQIGLPECPWKTEPTKGHRCDFHRFRRIASGDKRGQADTTGAFGIGFISVYQITDKPELFSAGRHWLLHEERDESHRIEVCLGCSACRDPKLPNTRFYLPWASDPSSLLRTALRAEAATSETPQRLIRELQGSLPTAMLFLKRLDKVSVLQEGKPLRTLERLAATNGELLLTDNEKNDRIWCTLTGNFAERAAELRSAYPNKIEPKRSPRVTLAISYTDLDNGLLCAYLPTQLTTGLPFHVNADFFPSNDRKRIILEQDYQSAWNREAIRAAASTLVDNIATLCGRLGHVRFWSLIARIHDAAVEAENGQRDKIFGVFWSALAPKLASLPVVFTTVKTWRKPSETFLLHSKDEAPALPLLERLGLSMVCEDLFPHHNLLRGSPISIGILTTNQFSQALKNQNLTHRLTKEEWPDFLKSKDALTMLWQQIGRLLDRHQVRPVRKLDLAKFSPIAIALGRDGALWPCSQLFRADDQTILLFNSLDPTIPFAASELDEYTFFADLCPSFDVRTAIDHLRKLGAEAIAKAVTENRLSLSNLFAWFDTHKAELVVDPDLKKSLAALPIFPSAGALKPLTGLALPGDFTDPLQLAALVDVEALGGRRDFLRDLDAPELDFSNYALQHIPQALAQSALPMQKRRDAVLLLANNHGKIMDDEGCRQALAATAIVECEDGIFRIPSAVYFKNEIILEVLGNTVPLAKIPAAQGAAISAFYQWLGLEKRPRFDSVVSRVEALVANPPDDSERKSIKRIFTHLAERVRNGAPSSELARLKSLAWLPARHHLGRWFVPSELYAVFQEYLFESQATFLDFDTVTQTSGADLLSYLGVGTTPTVVQVVDHLLYCAERDTPVNLGVYLFLNQKSDSPAIGQLRGKRCLLLQDGSYIAPAHVFWSEHPFGRFRMRLGPDLRKYSDLFQRLGIRDTPTHQDALTLLLEISNQFAAGNRALDPEANNVLLACWRMLESAMDSETISASDFECLRDLKCVPNADSLLTAPTWMFFEDRAGLAAKFEGFLKYNVIHRPLGASRAMAAAGVRTLASSVELQILECSNPIESISVKQRIAERKDQITRVLEAQSDHTHPGIKLADLDLIRFESASLLTIRYSLNAFNTTLVSHRENCPALFQAKENLILFVALDNRFPWAPIAREIALALCPDLEPGRIAPGLKEVLSAESTEAAKTALDELGFIVLDTTTVIAPASATISQLGGGTPPSSQNAQTQEDGVTNAPATPTPTVVSSNVASNNPLAELIDGIAAIPCPGTTATPPPSEFSQAGASTDGRPNGGSPSGDGTFGGAYNAGGSRTRTGQRAPRRGRLRSYVVRNSSPSPNPPDSEAAERRNSLAEAGIAKVVASEQSCHRKPEVKPPNHKGYDIESRDASSEIIRYIEVKSVSGPWNACGVGLTYSEFEKAQELGSKYWLYVVECADQPEARIYQIQNPALNVDQFMYDDGWSEAAEAAGAMLLPQKDPDPITEL